MHTPPHLQCPLCRQPLRLQERTLRCPNNHCFDQARQGYFHLLPVQHKRSRAPGDDAAMVASRQRFLELGHYQPIAEQLCQWLPNHNPCSLSLLDCGCGEGYYTERLAQCLPAGAEVIGLDISKDAVKRACRRHPGITWLVASGANQPIADHSLDILCSLFTPLWPREFHRVLKPGGQLLLATAGPDHLLQLRQQIYRDVKRQHYDPTPQLRESLEIAEHQQQRLRFDFHLDSNEQLMDLLAMTPHHWRTPADARARLGKLRQLDLSADIQLHNIRLQC